MQENAFPYCREIYNIFEDDKEFMEKLKEAKDTDFIAFCSTEFDKIWVGMLDWLANLVRPEIFEEIAALLVGYIVFIEVIKNQKRDIKLIDENIVEYCAGWRQIINEKYFCKDKLTNFRLVFESYPKLLEESLKDLLDEEIQTPHFEPLDKILDGTFVANLLYKTYNILFHRKIVDRYIPKEEFWKVSK